MEARALVREARAQYFPTVTAGPSFSRSRSSGNLSNTANANTGRTGQIYSLPLEVSWTPDLFGRIRNQVREAQYNAQVSAADLENERLVEQADLAQYYFEIRGQDALIQLDTQTVAAYQKSVELTQAQYDTGVGDKLSLVESQTTLESAQASLTNLGILRAQYEHAIAVLIGKQASTFSLPPRPITTAPPPIPVGLPSLLLQRRPDVAAAERNMASANAALGVAYTAFFPTLTLSAGGGFESSTFKHIADWPSRFWSVGPTFLAADLQRCAERRAAPVCRHLQRRCRQLSPDRAGRVSAGGRLFSTDTDTFAADPAAAPCGRLGANLARPRASALLHGHRPVHRRCHPAEHVVQQPANPDQPAN